MDQRTWRWRRLHQRLYRRSGIEEADWDDYREGVLRQEYGDERFEEEGAEELSELYGYEDENWAREYVDEYRGSDFREYLRELAVEDDDVRQNAYEEARENFDYDDWIQWQLVQHEFILWWLWYWLQHRKQSRWSFQLVQHLLEIIVLFRWLCGTWRLW